MTPTVLYGPPPETLNILLEDPSEHDHPAAARILHGLSADQAFAEIPGSPYTITQLLAHVNANLQFNLQLLESDDPVSFVNPLTAWPEVEKSDWAELRESFLTGLATLQRFAAKEDLTRVLYPATEGESAWTVGYKLAASVAKHTTYHLGHIVLLRRLLNAWPPA